MLNASNTQETNSAQFMKIWVFLVASFQFTMKSEEKKKLSEFEILIDFCEKYYIIFFVCY